MQTIQDIYQDQLIYIFRKDQCTSLAQDYLVVIKDDCPVTPIENCLIMHYQDDFESLLKMSLPTKMRKTKQLLSYAQALALFERQTYGVLSFQTEDIPYSIGINHVLINHHLYFHCALDGFKLKGIDQRAALTVIEDLGINLDAGTHNHQSAYAIGTLKKVNDDATKKAVLLKIVEKLAPKHPYHDKMLAFTNILELDIDYMIAKSHIR